MSKLLIQQYYTKLDKVLQYGGSRNETSIRRPFENLLNDYAQKKNLELVPELYTPGTLGKPVKPDGILKNALRLDFGYWESKDEKDDINEEINTKIKKGYPLGNTLFEDGKTAVLFQNGFEIKRANMRDVEQLDKILNDFISYEKAEIKDFNIALQKFKEDTPHLVETLRSKIEAAGKDNNNFIKERAAFLEVCRVEINPDISEADIREMIIQHILTADIFAVIFDESHFHHENNVARELEKLIDTFFTGSARRNALETIQHYYKTINTAAASIPDHHEKQKFLKILYENFYKAYNPKGADKLGIVYTPNEIVQFMIKNTDNLIHKYFGKTLADKNVEILDPATGTGTFICDILEYIPKQYLAHKYINEIHANEVAILPYYIANLNIEFTFKQRMGYYESFPNSCFVDTLDNTASLSYNNKQHDMFGFSSENAERIKRQNEKKISVIIGNPPYNANQQSENDNNKKRDYLVLDKRIKDTYVKHSNSQKTKVYDMYARFFRWSSDRLTKDGIISFVTNSSFINARGFDGFRKSIQEEFDFAYIIDLDGDVRNNPAQAKANVFGIMVGVAIVFLIKTKETIKKHCEIRYFKPDFILAKEKLDFLINNINNVDNIQFEKITPDKNNNWINQSDNDFEELLPLVDKKNKNTLFHVSSNGISTNRDEWVYDIDKRNLINKSNFFIEEYNSELKRWIKYKKENNYVDIKAESNPILDSFLHSRNLIKWSKMIKRDKFRKGKKGEFDLKDIRLSSYRPFTKQYLYYGYLSIDLKGAFDTFFPTENTENIVIAINHTSSKDFNVLASDKLIDLHFNGDSNCVPLYYFKETGEKIINITDWGYNEFINHYKDKKIKKEDIFNYTYAVLHNPKYRIKYELNLKREFPRLPFYNDFWKWCSWGKKLIDLHVNYEKTTPYDLTISNLNDKKIKKVEQKKIFSDKVVNPLLSQQAKIKVKLKADKTKNEIHIDDETIIQNIPHEAWAYELGNRSALEWILDQYKEKKISDPTLNEKFNNYNFFEYKQHVIDLLKKITNVSVETMKIVNEMEKENNQN